MTPLAIDLFCGLGGWTEGLLVEGYRVIGFDNERHVYGAERYPAQLVLQDVLTIHGSQFKNAALIVGSSPCQEFSYRAMPWKRAKALPPPYLGIQLFEAQFRIQREAIEAAGHFIPLVVENVRGAQKYVGRSKYHFGSFHLWGDVPALMPMARGRKNTGGSWFNVAHNTKSGHGQNPDGRKHGGDCFSDPTWPGKQGGVKHRRISKGWRDKHYDQTEKMQIAGDGVKQAGIAGVRNNGKGDRWFQDGAATHGSKSPARKRASAMIAKIPLVLSRHIAAAWYPVSDGTPLVEIYAVDPVDRAYVDRSTRV